MVDRQRINATMSHRNPLTIVVVEYPEIDAEQYEFAALFAENPNSWLSHWFCLVNRQ